MKPGMYVPRNTDFHGEEVLKLSAVLASGLPRASPRSPSPTGVPAQPAAPNLSDAIWLETRWRHNWVKTCVTGKESPKSGAPHCAVLPAGPREAMPSCHRVSASVPTHMVTSNPGPEATPPQSLTAGGQKHMRHSGGWKWRWGSSTGAPCCSGDLVRAPGESALRDRCKSQLRSTHARPCRDSRLFLLILLTDGTRVSPSAKSKQQEASGGPGRRQVRGMAGQRGRPSSWDPRGPSVRQGQA